MRSIAYKEGVTIAPQALHEVIAASGHDIRQVSRTDRQTDSRYSGIVV